MARLGDGIGVQCPVCPAWCDGVAAWWGHLRAEHPAEAARFAAACRSNAGAEAREVRRVIRNQLSAEAAQLRQVRRRQPA